MALNRGQAIARSGRLDYSTLISGLQQEDIMMRQAKLDRQAKIDKQAAGFELPGDFNEWDDPVVKGFVESRIQDLGNYINDHPDWETDTNHLMEVNKIRKSLVYDERISKAKRVDGEYKTWQKFLSSERAGEWLDSPEYQQVENEWNNYRQYGDINGEAGGGGEFRFKHPAKAIDLDRVWSQSAQAVTYDVDEAYGNRGRHQQISQGRKLQWAEGMLDDTGINGRATRTRMDELVEQGIIENTREAKLNYIKNKGEVVMAADKWDKGFADNNRGNNGSGMNSRWGDLSYDYFAAGARPITQSEEPNYIPRQKDGTTKMHSQPLQFTMGKTDDKGRMIYMPLETTVDGSYTLETGRGRAIIDDANGTFSAGNRMGIETWMTFPTSEIPNHIDLLNELEGFKAIEDTQLFDGWGQGKFQDLEHQSYSGFNQPNINSPTNTFDELKINSKNFQIRNGVVRIKVAYPHDYNEGARTEVGNHFTGKAKSAKIGEGSIFDKRIEFDRSTGIYYEVSADGSEREVTEEYANSKL